MPETAERQSAYGKLFCWAHAAGRPAIALPIPIAAEARYERKVTVSMYSYHAGDRTAVRRHPGFAGIIHLLVDLAWRAKYDHRGVPAYSSRHGSCGSSALAVAILRAVDTPMI